MGDFANFYSQYQIPMMTVAAGLCFLAFVSGVIEMILGARKTIKGLGILSLRRRNVWGQKNF